MSPKIQFPFFIFFFLVIVASLLVIPNASSITYTSYGYTTTSGSNGVYVANRAVLTILPLGSSDTGNFILIDAKGILASSSGTANFKAYIANSSGYVEYLSEPESCSTSQTTVTFDDWGDDNVVLTDDTTYRFGVVGDVQFKVYQPTATTTYNSDSNDNNYTSIAVGTFVGSGSSTTDVSLWITVATYVFTPTPTPSPTPSPTPLLGTHWAWNGTGFEAYNVTEETTSDVLSYLGLMILFCVCCGVGVWGAGAWGFFAGFNIAMIIGYVYSLIPIWAIVLIAVLDGVLLFGKIQAGRNMD